MDDRHYVYMDGMGWVEDTSWDRLTGFSFVQKIHVYDDWKKWDRWDM